MKRGNPAVVRRAARAIRDALGRRLERQLTRRYTGDFGGLAYLDDLGVQGEGRVFYEPSRWVPTTLALRRLDLGPDDVFADLGAGKGVAAVLAARFPIRRVIGVELSPELASTARENVERNQQHLRAGKVEIVTCDATEWEIPDDLTVLFLHNPFIGTPFHRVMERVFDAFDRRHRPLRVVYSYPWEHNWLISTGRVQAIDVVPRQMAPRARSWWMHDEVIVTYAMGGPANGQRPRRRVRRKALERWNAPNDTRFVMHRPGQPPVWSHWPDRRDGGP